MGSLFKDQIWLIIREWKFQQGIEPDAPLDGDDVDHLIYLLKAKINLHEGNITEEEYFNLKPYDQVKGENHE